MHEDCDASLALQQTLAALQQELADLRAQLAARSGLPIGDISSDERVLLSPQDLAALTGFSIHTIRDWCEQGLLPAQKIGNRWRIERQRAILAVKSLNRKRRSKRRG